MPPPFREDVVEGEMTTSAIGNVFDHARLHITVLEGGVTPLREIHRTDWRLLPFYVLVCHRNVRSRVRQRELDYIADDGESYGVFANSIPPVIMALCDCRPGKPWMYFNMHQIPSLMLDATAALRSNFQADVIQMTAAQIMPAGILDARNREEDWTSDGDGVRLPPFGGKLPVS